MRVRTAAILASASALRAPGARRTTKLPQRLFSAAFDEPGDDYDVAAPPPESLEYLSVLAGGETYTREFKTCQSRSGVFLRISESPRLRVPEPPADPELPSNDAGTTRRRRSSRTRWAST